MFQIRYKLCKRATLKSKTYIYYLNVINKEEVIRKLDLYPVINLYVTTNSYSLYMDVLVNKDKVSAYQKTNINLYKDLTFTEVLEMMNEFYNIKESDIAFINGKINIIQIMQLIIANWEDWHQ